MFKIILPLAILGVIAAAPLAKAECSLEELGEKEKVFTELAVNLKHKAPVELSSDIEAMQQDIAELQKADNLDALCRFYDSWIEKLKN